MAGQSYDAAVVKGSFNFAIMKKTIKLEKGKKARKETIGLFASILCPRNHQRQVALTFVPERGGHPAVPLLA